MKRTNEPPKAKVIAIPTAAEVTVPKPPEKPSGAAAALWDRHTGELARRGLLYEFTASFFMIVCWIWAHYCAISDQLARDGLMVSGPRGRKVSHPLLTVQATTLKAYRMLARDMGMQPRARGGREEHR